MSNKKKDTSFQFWVPIEIEKAKNEETGKDEMKFKGIASTNDEDTDGEFLDPKGFDLSFLKKAGFVNWHHGVKGSPKAIIGEPTKANVIDKGLYLECKLYDTPLAHEVYDAAKMLEAESETRRLGFSIEGKAMEKDAANPKKITKAKITGVAITHMPKNPATFAEIMKGDVENNEFEFNDEETDVIAKAEVQPRANGGGITILTDDAEITIEGGKLNVTMKKGLSTDSTAPLIREDLEGATKHLTKAEVYEKIFLKSSNINVPQAQKIYSIITKIAENMSTKKEKIQITDDAIEKAWDTLGLNNISKAKGAKEDEEDEEETDEEEVAGDGKEKKGKKTTKDEAEFKEVEKGKGKYHKFVKGERADEEEYEKCEKGGVDEYKKIEKAAAAVDEEEEEEASVEEKPKKGKKGKKGEDEDEGDVMKALSDNIDKKFGAVGLLMKSVRETLSEITTSQAELAERLEKIESEPVNKRKSIEKAIVIDKDFGNEAMNDAAGDLVKGGGTILSVKKDKKKILDALEEATFTKGGGMDDEFAKALTTFESSSFMSPDIQRRLLNEKKILVVN